MRTVKFGTIFHRMEMALRYQTWLSPPLNTAFDLVQCPPDNCAPRTFHLKRGAKELAKALVSDVDDLATRGASIEFERLRKKLTGFFPNIHLVEPND